MGSCPFPRSEQSRSCLSCLACFHCGLRPSELRGPDGAHQRRFSPLQQRLCGMCASAVVLAGLQPSRVWPVADACALNSRAFRPAAVFLRLCKTCDQDDHKVCWAQPAKLHPQTFQKKKSFRLTQCERESALPTHNSSADLTRMIMLKDEISSFAAHVGGMLAGLCGKQTSTALENVSACASQSLHRASERFT